MAACIRRLRSGLSEADPERRAGRIIRAHIRSGHHAGVRALDPSGLQRPRLRRPDLRRDDAGAAGVRLRVRRSRPEGLRHRARWSRPSLAWFCCSRRGATGANCSRATAFCSSPWAGPSCRRSRHCRCCCTCPGSRFTDAYFEAMSGLTTTGATVLSGLDQLPLSINVWRHLLVWMGGMGILVLVVAILPLLGVGGAQVFKAETAGPFKETKLTPRIADTAKALYSIYFGISLVCFLAYRWAGMTWSDAFMHMCSTMGLGGFSSHDASFGYFNSPLIDYTAVCVHDDRRIQLLAALHRVAAEVARAVLDRSGGQGLSLHAGRRLPGGGRVPVPQRRLQRPVDRRCATRRSTSSRSRRRPAMPTPTTTSGPSSRRC